MDFYVDGAFLSSAPINSGDLYMIEEGGELVVGQDQDCMLGCYQVFAFLIFTDYYLTFRPSKH